MARTVRDTKLESRAARERLKATRQALLARARARVPSWLSAPERQGRPLVRPPLRRPADLPG